MSAGEGFFIMVIGAALALLVLIPLHLLLA